VQLEDDEDKGQRGIQSVEVGGRLLQALTDRPASMTLKDLAAAAELPASRAHPYLVSFGKLGLVEQDPQTGRYALGPMALQMGLSCLHQSDPIKAATPVAEALARRIDQTVVIAVWANFGPTVVRLIEGSQPLHVNMRVGTVMSILGTATGRAFAAAMNSSTVFQGASPFTVMAAGSALRRAIGVNSSTPNFDKPRCGRIVSSTVIKASL